jgi:hypothetical protein
MEQVWDQVGLEEAFGARDGSSDAMQAALGRWFSAYYEGGALQLPFTIVRKLTRAVFSEFRMENDLGKLPHRAALELALIGGESYLAPHFGDGRWHWRVIPRSSILVFARDGEGEPIDVGLTEKRLQGNLWFTLLERRRLDRRGLLTVTNRLFRSNSRGVLGREGAAVVLECEGCAARADFWLGGVCDAGAVLTLPPSKSFKNQTASSGKRTSLPRR